MPSQTPKGLKDLDNAVQASKSLLKQLQLSLFEIHRNPSFPPTKQIDGTVDALALVRDSASLIRAHSTKLSLLIVNEPFTPSAITLVIRDLTGGPIPCLAAALETCLPESYTAGFRRELAWRCRNVLLELGQLLEKVPKDGKALSSTNQGFASGDKGSLALTALLWSACDNAIALTSNGVGGFFVKKVEEWRDTLVDVMEELKEWGDEEPEDDDNDEDDTEGDELSQDGSDNTERDRIAATQEMLDDLMNSNSTIPRSDPDKIRPRLETTLKRLRLISILYQAIVKRRIKKLPSLPPQDNCSSKIKSGPARLDEVAKVLQQLPDRFGDLAAAFYDLDAVEIDQCMDQCFLDAFAAGELLSEPWEGGTDEFTDWLEKFKTEIKKD